LNDGTTAVPSWTVPGGHTGSHADIWRLLGDRSVVRWYYLGGIRVFEYGWETVWWWDGLGTLTSHAAPEFLDHHTSRS
jgi:hypothetical protein